MEENIAITIIRTYIERCQITIDNFTDAEDISVRITARGKIVMLEKIIKDIQQANP